jgi:hypothetical protein
MLLRDNVRNVAIGPVVSSALGLATTRYDTEDASPGATAGRASLLLRGSLQAFQASFDHRCQATSVLTVPSVSGTGTGTGATQIGALVPGVAGESYANAMFHSSNTAPVFSTSGDGFWYVAVYGPDGHYVTWSGNRIAIQTIMAYQFVRVPLLQPVVPLVDGLYSVMVTIYTGSGTGGAQCTITSTEVMTTDPMISGMPKLGFTANAGQHSPPSVPGTLGTTAGTMTLAYCALYT